jgi:forespore regulator of the sigma-K checkpoint
VTYSNLYKQLKRRLKMKKRWLSLGAYLLLAGSAVTVLWLHQGAEEPKPDHQAAATALNPNDISIEQEAEAVSAGVLESIRNGKGLREVVLHKQYVCGEETAESMTMTPQEILSFYKEHPGTLVSMEDSGRVQMVEPVEDLSPHCRENAYFGMDKNGNLSLFEGIPEQEKVIRTFFQLDVQHMKSSLPGDAVNQLYSGIRVSDMEDYNSVLSTFSEYASSPSAPVGGNAQGQ